jgi:hypothetical protein
VLDNVIYIEYCTPYLSHYVCSMYDPNNEFVNEKHHFSTVCHEQNLLNRLYVPS